MQRILQVNINNEGGAFSLVYQVQKRIDANRYMFDYFTMGKFNRGEVLDDLIARGSHIYEANLRGNRLIGHLILPFYFFHILKDNGYDKIHVHSDSAWKMLLYAIPAKMANVQCIIIHSHSSGINGDSKTLKKALHLVARHYLKKIGSIFIACSTEASQWMYGNQNSDVEIIRNGVDLNRFKPNKEARINTRKNLHFKNDDIVIGTVGDFSDTKNPTLLIEIYEALLKNNSNFKLLFVGTGYNEAKIKKLVEQKKIQSKVCFMGRSDKVQDVLNAMDAFVLPSKFEGLPVSAIEAQATGLPTFLSPNITREAGIQGFSWYAQEYMNIEQWKNLIMEKMNLVDSQIATIAVKEAGFDIEDTVKSFERIYS